MRPPCTRSIPSTGMRPPCTRSIPSTGMRPPCTRSIPSTGMRPPCTRSIPSTGMRPPCHKVYTQYWYETTCTRSIPSTGMRPPCTRSIPSTGMRPPSTRSIPSTGMRPQSGSLGGAFSTDSLCVLQAANYLDIKGLLDILCKAVADMIRGKDPQEIRRAFNASEPSVSTTYPPPPGPAPLLSPDSSFPTHHT